jgi:hypothetical protein
MNKFQEVKGLYSKINMKIDDLMDKFSQAKKEKTEYSIILNIIFRLQSRAQ